MISTVVDPDKIEVTQSGSADEEVGQLVRNGDIKVSRVARRHVRLTDGCGVNGDGSSPRCDDK